MRRLLLLASAMVFLDTTFFTVVAPLLPTYKHDLHLSTAQAGVLTAAYAAGTLTASLPAGYFAGRFGPRRTAVVGLLVLGVVTLLFGFLKSIYPLDVARFIQGAASALIWSGALTWLINASPDDKRGQVIGTALGSAVAGSLVGPALGALAGSIGTEVVFGAVCILAIGLAYLAMRTPDQDVRETQPLRTVLRCLVDRRVLEAAVFVGAPSLMFGAVDVLVPLRINTLGGGHVLIAVGFIGGAAVESVLSPVAGRLADRVGRRSPYVLGMVIGTVSMVLFALAGSLPVVIASLIVCSLGAGLCFAPAMTLISDGVEESGLHQGYAAAVTNMAWAGPQVIGGVAGAAVAGATGDAAPSIAIAVLLVLTIGYAFRTLADPAPAEA
ncbi:MAG TPA: MFS transporter [Solirubrobacterales bacterium]|nr:MFS transporter [Solirubrobacterales bacterium]